MGLTRGFDKEMREIVERAIADGWTARPTRNGHVFMQHPSGGKVTVPSKNGSSRNVKNIEHAIRRAEEMKEIGVAQPAVEVEAEWVKYRTPSGVVFDRRLIGTANGKQTWEYRCVECGRDGMIGGSAAGGHYSRSHSPNKWTGGSRKRPVEPLAVIEPVTEPLPVVEVAAPVGTPLAAKVAALVEEEVGALYLEVETLRAEVKRLRDHLAALASLAAEVQ